MNTRTKVILTKDEKDALEAYATTGKRPVKIVRRAKVILALDVSDGKKALTQSEISKKYDITRQGIIDIKNDFLAKASIEEFLSRKKRETPLCATKDYRRCGGKDYCLKMR